MVEDRMFVIEKEHNANSKHFGSLERFWSVLSVWGLSVFFHIRSYNNRHCFIKIHSPQDHPLCIVVLNKTLHRTSWEV